MGNLAEGWYNSSPTNANTDGDNFGDANEVYFYGSDPAVSNPAVTVSGTTIYKNAATNKPMRTLLSPTRGGWNLALSHTRTNAGAFTITNVPGNQTYFLKSFLDVNTNGAWEPSDVPGSYSPLAATVGGGGLSGATVTVQKTRGLRVDFAYYGAFSPTGAVNLIVSNALAWGVNTIYPLAYSYEFGTYWKDPDTGLFLFHETTKGIFNILPILIQKAHSNGIQVIAWMQPANGFTNTWA